MFEVGTRVEVYSVSGTIAYVGIVTGSGSSESCEGPDCSRCNRKMHTPVREDGVDYSMGIATSHVAAEGTRARSFKVGERVTIDGEFPATVGEGPEECEECQSGKHICVSLDVDRGAPVSFCYTPNRVARIA